jgi:hypothetical protein
MQKFILIRLEEDAVKAALVDQSFNQTHFECERVSISMRGNLTNHCYLSMAEPLCCCVKCYFVLRNVLADLSESGE